MMVIFGLLFVLALTSSVSGQCNRRQADIVFIADESYSIDYEPWNDQKKFINSLIDSFEIGEDATRIGLITYSSKARMKFRLNSHFDKKSLEEAVNGLVQKGGNTYTWLALDMAREQMFIPQAGSRTDDPSIPKIIIIITDGNSQRPRDTAAAAKKVRRAGIKIYAIGVGSEAKISPQELLNIGGISSHVFRVSNYEQLKGIKIKVVSQTCKTTPAPTRPPSELYPECKDKEADVMLMMDTSENAKAEQIADMKNFMQRLVYSLDLSHTKTRVGLITFAARATLVFRLGEFSSADDIHDAIAAVSDTPSATGANLAEAMQMANSQAFNPATGGRVKIAKAVVLLTTGGASNQNLAIENARQLMADRGVRIIALGIASANLPELASISGTEDLVRVSSSKSLPSMRTRVVAKICESRPSPNDFPCGELEGIDLAFVMNTHHANDDDLGYSSRFMQTVSEGFEIAPTKVQVSVVPSKCLSIPGFNFKRYGNKDDLLKGLELVQPRDLGSLLTEVTTETFTEKNGARASGTVNQVMVIVTDTKPSDEDIAKAEEAKRRGMKVFVIGIGKRVSGYDTYAMASEPNLAHAFSVESYEQLYSNEDIIKRLKDQICLVSE